MNKKIIDIMTILGLAFMLLFQFLPTPAGLTTLSMQTIGIFIGSMLLWNFVGIGWPSFLCLVLLTFFQIMKPGMIFSAGIGSSAVNFLIAFFMLSYTLSKVGFTKRLAILCISNPISRKGPWAFTTMFLFSAVFIASFMSQTAVALVFIPIAEQIFKEVGYEKGEEFSQMLILGIGFSVGLGSACTPLGHTIILIPMQLLETNYHLGVNILNYSIFGYITCTIIFILMMLVFRFIYNPDVSKIRNYNSLELRKQLTTMSTEEKIYAFFFAIVIVIWFLQGILPSLMPGTGKQLIGLGNVMPVMAAIVILCLIRVKGVPVMDFADAAKNGVPWVAIIFTSAVMVISASLTQKSVGFANFIVTTVSPLVANMEPVIFMMVIAGLAVFVTNFASNTVVTSVFFTLAAPIAVSMGNVNLGTLASMVGAAASFAYATPPATLPMAVVAGTGWVNNNVMFKYGMILCFISIVILVGIGFPLANLLLS